MNDEWKGSYSMVFSLLWELSSYFYISPILTSLALEIAVIIFRTLPATCFTSSKSISFCKSLVILRRQSKSFLNGRKSLFSL